MARADSTNHAGLLTGLSFGTGAGALVLLVYATNPAGWVAAGVTFVGFFGFAGTAGAEMHDSAIEKAACEAQYYSGKAKCNRDWERNKWLKKSQSTWVEISYLSCAVKLGLGQGGMSCGNTFVSDATLWSSPPPWDR